jgi:hypothetical protein
MYIRAWFNIAYHTSFNKTVILQMLFESLLLITVYQSSAHIKWLNWVIHTARAMYLSIW